MGIDSGLYNVLLVLHILTAIVGFGGVMLNGVHGMQAKRRQGREGLAIVDSTIAVTDVAQKFIYAVFVFGILLLVVSDGSWQFDHLWLTLSVLLYVVAVGLAHGVLQKNVKRMRALMAELADGPPPGAGAGSPAGTGGPPPQVAEIEQRGRTVGIVSMVLDLMVIGILALMIWKPL